MIMQDWTQSGAGRAADTDAQRDPAGTVPDPPRHPPAADDSADWDELTPVETSQVSPPADVLVAGAPLAESSPRPGQTAPGAAAAGPTSGALSFEQSPGGSSSSGTPIGAGTATEPGRGSGGGVLDSGAADGFHARWRDVQFGFVDDPREAVRQADRLADEVLGAVADALAARKRALEERVSTERDATQDTERLRHIVRAYREFVDRLLTT
jgi:hypothetical protein